VLFPIGCVANTEYGLTMISFEGVVRSQGPRMPSYIIVRLSLLKARLDNSSGSFHEKAAAGTNQRRLYSTRVTSRRSRAWCIGLVNPELRRRRT
jgi:hypothetical protein